WWLAQRLAEWWRDECPPSRTCRCHTESIFKNDRDVASERGQLDPDSAVIQGRSRQRAPGLVDRPDAPGDAREVQGDRRLRQFREILEHLDAPSLDRRRVNDVEDVAAEVVLTQQADPRRRW